MYKVGYATGSRADYGIVRKYLLELNKNEAIDLSLLVTGTHLEKKFGYTINEIRNDGIKIDCEIPIEINSSDNEHIINSMAICLRDFGKYLGEHKYDLLIILGDRYEMLSVATAAAINTIPILHIHGGEITLGNYDEFIRHSITKMSKYHFTSTESYRKRVIQLGENPDNVYYLGALGPENAIQNTNQDLKLNNENKYIIILFHPETVTHIDANKQISILLEALCELKSDYKLKFIGNNSDTNADVIKKRILDFCKDNKCEYIVNLVNTKFHNLLHNATCFIGNSSSGIIEAPSLGVYSVNIGDRQKGRIRGNSVIDVKCEKKSIVDGINKAIEMKQKNVKINNPYYKENCLKLYVETTMKILRHIDTEPKEFYDFID